MRFEVYYGIRAKPELRDCEEVASTLLECLWDESVLIRKDEGGRSFWNEDDHKAVVKIIFLAERKTEFGDDFFSGVPLSVDLFDRWWTLERYEAGSTIGDALDNIDAKYLSNVPSTGRAHVDEYLGRLRDAKPRTEFWTDPSKYRVWWNGDVIGWIEEPVWEMPFLRGKWVPTINQGGKQFALQLDPGTNYQVRIDGDNYLRSELCVDGDSAVARVTLISPDRS